MEKTQKEKKMKIQKLYHKRDQLIEYSMPLFDNLEFAQSERPSSVKLQTRWNFSNRKNQLICGIWDNYIPVVTSFQWLMVHIT